MYADDYRITGEWTAIWKSPYTFNDITVKTIQYKTASLPE